MNFDVELSRRAQQDLEKIVAYLASKSRQGAASWLSSWSELLLRLSSSAGSCPIAPEADDHRETIRHAVFGTRHGRKFRALFVIRGTKVFVTNIRGPGKDFVRPEELGA